MKDKENKKTKGKKVNENLNSKSIKTSKVNKDDIKKGKNNYYCTYYSCCGKCK